MEKHQVIYEALVIQILSIICLLIVIILLFRQFKSNKYEQRIGKFSLFAKNDIERSFFDKLFAFLKKNLQKISIFLIKSNLLKNYGEKYEKFITFEEKEFKQGIDYVALKILISVSLLILSLFTMTFQYTKFSLPTFMLIILLGFFLPDLYLNILFKRKRKQVEEDLLKAIIIMNNAFKSGSNITQAVHIVKNELEGPISDEFQKIYIDINYGLSLDTVFNRFYERVKIEDAKYITSSLSLLNKTGGNIVKVFSLIEKTFFDKKKMKNELDSLTASSNLIYKLLIAMPFFLVGVICLLSPNYFSPLYKTKIGFLILILIFFLYFLYIFIIKKLIQVKI